MILKRIARWMAFVAVIAAWPVAAPAQSNPPSSSPSGQRNLAVDDFLALKDVAYARISPDGKWVAYTVKTLDLAEDKSQTQERPFRALPGLVCKIPERRKFGRTGEQ